MPLTALSASKTAQGPALGPAVGAAPHTRLLTPVLCLFFLPLIRLGRSTLFSFLASFFVFSSKHSQLPNHSQMILIRCARVLRACAVRWACASRACVCPTPSPSFRPFPFLSFAFLSAPSFRSFLHAVGRNIMMEFTLAQLTPNRPVSVNLPSRTVTTSDQVPDRSVQGST